MLDCDALNADLMSRSTLESSSAFAAPMAAQDGRWQLLSLYLEAAIQSANLRVCRAIYQDLFGSVSFGDPRLNNYRSALDSTRKALRRLGSHCRKFDIDPSQHSLFTLLELPNELLDHYQRGRRIETKHLTPALIYKAGVEGWRVHYCGWTMQCCGFTEMDDHYGQPTFGYPLKIKGPAGQLHILEMPALPIQRAREAYTLITGHKYYADDGLGSDAPHPAERCG